MKTGDLFQFSLGQIIFIVLCLLIAGFFDFYLGARFGPQVFWGIEIDRLSSVSLLPDNISDEELEGLLKEEGSYQLTFYDALEKKQGGEGDSLKVELVQEKKVELVQEKKKEEELKQETEPQGGTASLAKKSDLVANIIDEQLSENMVRYTLQVASYHSSKKAEKLEKKLKESGYPVTVETLTLPDNEKMYLIYVGDYSSLEEAKRGENLIQKNFGLVPRVIEK